MPIEGDSTAVPGGYSRVDPWVISRDSDAEIEFLRRAFGAQERPSSRVRNPDGRIGHVEVELAGSVVLMFDAQPGWPELPAHLLREVKRFFEDYKALENKTVVVEDFLDRTKALESITQAIERYRQHRDALVKANRKEGA